MMKNKLILIALLCASVGTFFLTATAQATSSEEARRRTAPSNCQIVSGFKICS